MAGGDTGTSDGRGAAADDEKIELHRMS